MKTYAKKSFFFLAIICGLLVTYISGQFLIRIYKTNKAYRDNRNKYTALTATLSESCVGFDEDAVTKAKNFCDEFNLSCGNKYVPSTWVYIDYTVPESSNRQFNGLTLYRTNGTKTFAFEKTINSLQTTKTIRFGVDCKTKEIYLYDNKWQYWNYVEKYGAVNPFKAKWPEPISEEDAEKIIKGIAKKIATPKDMFFDGMKKEKDLGVWNGYWVRKKDGYAFEDDWMVISIMGATGEFVGYEKRYGMQPCPAIANITRESALEIARSIFREKVSDKVRQKEKDLYTVNSNILIIQPSRYQRPMNDLQAITDKSSKLAWIIEYKPNIQDNSLKEIEFHLLQLYFKVIVDAATGEVIYASDIPMETK